MKVILSIFLWLWPCFGIAQVKEVSSVTKDTTKGSTIKSGAIRPEIFTSGFIDIVNSGQVNASARFIRLVSSPFFSAGVS